MNTDDPLRRLMLALVTIAISVAAITLSLIAMNR